jgi:hypothetical protein
MKATALMMFLVIAVTCAGAGIAGPMADLARTSLPQPRATQSFRLRGNGVQYDLDSRVGLFVHYTEMQPASGALSPLETGPRAMPPVSLGRFLVSAGLRVYVN